MKRFFIAASTAFTVASFSWFIWWGLAGLPTTKIVALSIPIIWCAFTFDVFITTFISVLAKEIGRGKK